ncbi:MAG: nicotinate-nucleotide--dimethylbenzimidazole phosphoribosyltransferase [Pseudomonadota bacterium]
MISDIDALVTQLRAAAGPDETARAAAEARNAVLTKPPGALGRLEEIAVWYAGWRGDPRARIMQPHVLVFAGNHGVTAQGVSAFPSEVTAQMVANFNTGGAAINALAETLGAAFSVHPLALDRPTVDFTQGPAMSAAECIEAINLGWRAVDHSADILVIGEMGIGNTTSAAAIACALYGGAPAEWTGRGTGVDDAGLARKTAAVAAGLAANPGAVGAPFAALEMLGGREIAAMVGAMAAARVARIPVVLDGFIASSAAAVLARGVPGATHHLIAGHLSAEGGHQKLLDALGLQPILSLGLRLGEGSGAALALGIIKAAVACHSGMATFDEAAVASGA